MRRHAVLTGFLALGLLAGASSAAAHATDPPELLGHTDVVHTCVSSRGGMVQVVDATTGACQFGGTALHWNLVGTPGPRGETGAPGTAGPPGANATGLIVLAGGLCAPQPVDGGTESVTFRRPGACLREPVPLPVAGVLSGLRVRQQVEVPYGATVTVEVVLNESVMELACSMSSPAEQCADLLTAIPVLPDDRLGIRLVIDNRASQLDFTLFDLAFSVVLTPAGP